MDHYNIEPTSSGGALLKFGDDVKAAFPFDRELAQHIAEKLNEELEPRHVPAGATESS